MRSRSTARRARHWGCAAAATMLLPAVVAAPAHACSAPVPVGGSLAVHCPFVGTEQTFTVPASVRSLGVVAVGAPGYLSTGAIARARLAVTPGDVLYVEVGGPGQPTSRPTLQSAFNGGGFSHASGGGGGATDLRTCSITSPACVLTGDPSSDPRLVVAAGGGGSSDPSSGAGGQGGTPNGQAGATGTGPRAATGGQGATVVGPGLGPPPGSSFGFGDGRAGTGGTGTPGGSPFAGVYQFGGGGGGGGWFGGGGGGGGTQERVDGALVTSGGGGGGGGSSHGPPGATYAVDPTAAPSVMLTYTPVTPAPDFMFPALRQRRNASIAVTFFAPRAGVLKLLVRAASGPRGRFTFASARRSIDRRGTVRLVLAPTHRGAGLRDRHRRMRIATRVRVHAAFTASGATVRKAKTLRLRTDRR